MRCTQAAQHADRLAGRRPVWPLVLTLSVRNMVPLNAQALSVAA
jgi:hypothetical protein